MFKKYFIFAFLALLLMVVQATNPPDLPPELPPIRKPTPRPITPAVQTCPVPTEEMLRCMRQWACQYIIRLDLRCLLNLNGNPLLGGLLGGGSAGQAGGGGVGGILDGILG